jgi:mannose-6-phosphate isomerase-like protein (cupin superfamily)
MAIPLYSWSELPRQVLFDGNLSRTALRTDGALITFNWLEPHMPRPEPHSHPFDQLVMVVEGTLNLEIAADMIEMPPGSAVRIPSGVAHTAWPTGDQRVLNIDVFGTVRKDYLFLTHHQREVFRDAPLPGAVSHGFSIWNAPGSGERQD